MSASKVAHREIGPLLQMFRNFLQGVNINQFETIQIYDRMFIFFVSTAKPHQCLAIRGRNRRSDSARPAASWWSSSYVSVHRILYLYVFHYISIVACFDGTLNHPQFVRQLLRKSRRTSWSCSTSRCWSCAPRRWKRVSESTWHLLLILSTFMVFFNFAGKARTRCRLRERFTNGIKWKSLRNKIRIMSIKLVEKLLVER